ncbi:sensor histidine kinase [Listeria grandensis]|uniref:Sensor histidine kinase n=1 Tax=Listeria grandensis TaxID=1494963 RepID=A0A7X0Y3V9_9LIST|nr:ATP-binding protein [Listeria grandensis]MBC1475276.1 sensor histidine kinase [Listeria grandensis]MBC1936434.1 sensor histidine kinase [Listeria grandensis]
MEITSELFRKAYEQMSDAVFLLQGEGDIITSNPAANRLLDQYEVKLDDFCTFCNGYTSIFEERTCLGCSLRKRVDNESFQLFLNLKAGKNIPFSASYTLIDEKAGISVLILRNLTQQQHTEQLLKQKTMTEYVINAQENERKRLSRELHDGLAQGLFSTLIELRKIKYMTKKEDYESSLSEMDSMLATTLEDIRNMAVELRPSSLDDLGIFAALKAYFKRYEQLFGIHVVFVSELYGTRFPASVETMLYRVTQEALTNAAKYADVGEIEVYLFKTKQSIVLEINDQGIGFSPDHFTAQGSGLGLLNMKERVELLNGDFELRSEPQQGTKVLVRIPIDPKGGRTT